MENLLSVNELAFVLNVSVNTINNWYMWRRRNEEHELAKYLPLPQQNGERSKRLWKQGDIDKIRQFQQRIPRGRYGIMGDITQGRYKNEK